ncbi:caspase family protein, partial [Burkholderia sp. LMG 13014]
MQSRAGWAGATVDGGRAAGAKVALVIGNAAYDGADRLGSPANDAALIGRTFTQLGFETRIGTDLTRDEFNASVDWLAARARGAQVAIFYYAGHGFESGGDNFLVPVKTGIPIAAMTRATLLQRGIRFNAVRAQVKASRPDAFVALIDACR